MIDNPYEAPRADGLPSPRTDMQLAAKAFAGWLLGASLVAGVLTALQTGHALSAFGAETHIGRLLALSAFRVVTHHAVASAASVAIVIRTHPATPASTARRRVIRPWMLYATQPLATPIAAGLMIAAGTGTAALIYDLSPRASLLGLLDVARIEDPLYGIASACVYAIVLSAIVAAVRPQIAAARWGVAAKIVVALLATGFVTGIVGGTVNAARSLLERPPRGLTEDDASAARGKDHLEHALCNRGGTVLVSDM
jgi:hypothetical protein